MVETGLRRINAPRRKKRRGPMDLFSDFMYTIIGTFTTIITYVLVKVGTFIITFLQIIFNTIKNLLAPFTRFIASLVKSIYHRLGSFFPFGMREKIEETFMYSGLTRNPEETLGMTMVYSIVVPVAAGVLGFFYTGGDHLVAITAAVVSFTLVWLLLYMVLSLLVDRRTSNVEKVLPDMLSMIAQNMSAGMTPYNALWVAARPEFGALAEEIQRVARDTLTGTPLETALLNMSGRVNSEKLRRTIKLMIQGMRSGGELPTVLQEIARDIRIEQNLIKRMEGETTAQVLFILFSLIIGAPLLFAASSQFIGIFSTTLSLIDIENLGHQTQGSMVTLQQLPITEAEFVTFAYITLLVNCFFGSLTIGLMKSGKTSRGMTLIPTVIFLAIGIFWLLKYIMTSFFSGMMV